MGRLTDSALECIPVFLACSDANGLFNGDDKYLAVPYLTGKGVFFNCLYYIRDDFGVDSHLDFNLWQKIYYIFGAPVYLLVAFLSAKALDFGYGHAADSEFQYGLFDLFKLERFYDGFYLLQLLILLLMLRNIKYFRHMFLNLSISLHELYKYNHESCR